MPLLVFQFARLFFLLVSFQLVVFFFLGFFVFAFSELLLEFFNFQAVAI